MAGGDRGKGPRNRRAPGDGAPADRRHGRGGELPADAGGRDDSQGRGRGRGGPISAARGGSVHPTGGQISAARGGSTQAAARGGSAQAAAPGALARNRGRVLPNANRPRSTEQQRRQTNALLSQTLMEMGEDSALGVLSMMNKASKKGSERNSL